MSFFPVLLSPICILCAARTQRFFNICAPCERDLPILSQSCFKCAQPIFSANNEALICGFCLKNPPPFDATFALFSYEKPIVGVIKKLKFHGELSHAKALGELFLQRILDDWYREKPLPELIIPIPLHPKRLRERGFNQALEIARPIAKKLQIPIDLWETKRIKHTLAQSSLEADLRHENMKNAFEIRGNFRGKHVAVIDDVITTGSTISEFCRTLQAHGLVKIDVWCVARR
ncbi:MAG: competence protein F [uncultured bacterium]|nr:MAG: competence protein F [uncultured bacterium]